MVSISGSLKADSPPLPVDDTALTAFRNATQGRPVFLAAQTHLGEEEEILTATATLSQQFPRLLTVIVPRHPDRGESVALLARGRGFEVTRRAAGALPGATAQIYIADTLGELGLFYRAVGFVFLGGSLAARGGHNPLEPAILGASVITGPYTNNFEETFRALLAAQGDKPVRTAEELSAKVAALLADPVAAAEKGARAKAAVARLGGALEYTRAVAEELLARHARP